MKEMRVRRERVGVKLKSNNPRPEGLGISKPPGQQQPTAASNGFQVEALFYGHSASTQAGKQAGRQASRQAGRQAGGGQATSQPASQLASQPASQPARRQPATGS